MRPSNQVLMAALDAASNQVSVVIDAAFIYRFSAQASFSSNGLSGSLQLQGSNDPIAGIISSTTGKPVPVNWSNIGSAVSVASGATSLIPSQDVCYRWLQVTWTKSGGTGTITVNGNSIGF